VPRAEGGFVWDDRFLAYDFGPSHPFTQRSRRSAVRLVSALLGAGGGEGIERKERVPLASREYLQTFHRPEYLEQVRRASESTRRIPLDRGDTPSFPGCFGAAARIAAGTAWALENAVEARRPTFHPAGGLHHAHPRRASGFCVFNDVALAVGAAIRAGHRVAYLDIDAHHGDGVMYGFYGSGKVLDIDFHQDGRTIFPGTGFADEVGHGDGEGFKVNVALPPGAGDETLLPLFRRLVPPLIRSFHPGLIVLQHGVDGHAGDPLTALNYTSRSYDEIDQIVLALGRELCQSRVVVTGGGGYRPESVARVLARAGAAVLGAVLPGGHEPLPALWRAEFEEEWGYPAPTTWVDPNPRTGPPASGSRVEDIVRELEGTLGVLLPEVHPG
jgi:acetoin utilization protein AcuC